MPAEHIMPTEESQDLIDLTLEICAHQLAPMVCALTTRPLANDDDPA